MNSVARTRPRASPRTQRPGDRRADSSSASICGPRCACPAQCPLLEGPFTSSMPSGRPCTRHGSACRPACRPGNKRLDAPRTSSDACAHQVVVRARERVTSRQQIKAAGIAPPHLQLLVEPEHCADHARILTWASNVGGLLAGSFARRVINATTNRREYQDFGVSSGTESNSCALTPTPVLTKPRGPAWDPVLPDWRQSGVAHPANVTTPLHWRPPGRRSHILKTCFTYARTSFPTRQIMRDRHRPQPRKSPGDKVDRDQQALRQCAPPPTLFTTEGRPASSVESPQASSASRQHQAAPEVRCPDITGKGEDLDRSPSLTADPIVDALETRASTHPFPIQALTLGPALDHATTSSAQAKTGTGKTGCPSRGRHRARRKRATSSTQREQAAGSDYPADPQAHQAGRPGPLREGRQVPRPASLNLRRRCLRAPDRNSRAWRRHRRAARPAASTCARATFTCPASKPSSSVRSGEISTWASCPTSRRCSAASPGAPPHHAVLRERCPAVEALARRFMVQPHPHPRRTDDQIQTVNTVKRSHLPRSCHEQGRGRRPHPAGSAAQAHRRPPGRGPDRRSCAVGSLHGDLGQGARERSSACIP